MEKEWKYLNSTRGDVVTFNQPEEGFYGFVYMIEFENGHRYIGKKSFFSNRKRKFGKKEIAKLTDKRLKKYEIVKKESNWRTYTSSNPIVNSRIKNGEDYQKYVICLAKDKKHLSYLEEQELHRNYVLWDDQYLNDNIAGKYFKSDIERWV